MLFDKEMNYLDGGYEPVTSSSDGAVVQYSRSDIEVKKPGYVLVFVGNESSEPTDFVYFDDLTVGITPTQVVQYNEYYPFGLQTQESWSRVTDTENNFLFNAGSEMNNSTGMYETFFRQYDPTLGRFGAVDPMADYFGTINPYNFAFNDPAGINDPNGDDPQTDEEKRQDTKKQTFEYGRRWRNVSTRMGGDDDLVGSAFGREGSGIDWGRHDAWAIEAHKRNVMRRAYASGDAVTYTNQGYYSYSSSDGGNTWCSLRFLVYKS